MLRLWWLFTCIIDVSAQRDCGLLCLNSSDHAKSFWRTVPDDLNTLSHIWTTACIRRLSFTHRLSQRSKSRESWLSCLALHYWAKPDIYCDGSLEGRPALVVPADCSAASYCQVQLLAYSICTKQPSSFKSYMTCRSSTLGGTHTAFLQMALTDEHSSSA